MRRLILAALAAATLVPPAAAAAAPQSQAPQGRSCFFSNDWRGWRATPDSKAIYLRVQQSRIFRIDFAYQCPDLNRPMAQLITSNQTSSICTALDLDIRVTNNNFTPGVPCLVDKITALTPAEAKALPRNLVP